MYVLMAVNFINKNRLIFVFFIYLLMSKQNKQ